MARAAAEVNRLGREGDDSTDPARSGVTSDAAVSDARQMGDRIRAGRTLESGARRDRVLLGTRITPATGIAGSTPGFGGNGRAPALAQARSSIRPKAVSTDASDACSDPRWAQSWELRWNSCQRAATGARRVARS
jgi:hypothetical protein